MGKKKNKSKTTEKTVKPKQVSHPLKFSCPNWPLIVLAGLGGILTGYLAVSELGKQGALFCEDGSSCDLVQSSRWGSFLGIPTVLMGFAAYMAILLVGLKIKNLVQQWQYAWMISLSGLAYSIYLMVISVFVIEALCIYCLVSFALMSLIVGILVYQRPLGKPKFNFNVTLRQTAIVAVIFVGGMHLHYSGVFDPSAGPEDPYLKGLVQHLDGNKAYLYGAYW